MRLVDQFLQLCRICLRAVDNIYRFPYKIGNVNNRLKNSESLLRRGELAAK